MRRRKAIYNIITSIFLQIVTIFSGFIIPKLIISSFGSNVNGVISSATQFLSYITLLEAGIGGVARAALYKPLSKNDNKKIVEIIYSLEMFFRKIATFFLIYLAIISIIFKFISNSSLSYLSTFYLVIIIGISSFVQYYFGISYQVLLQADQRQYITNVIQIITMILNTIIMFFLIKLGFSIIAVKIGSTVILILRPLLINYYVKKKYKLDYTLCKKDNIYKFDQKYDGLAHHIAFFLHTNTDIVVITLFLDIGYVSVYAIYNMIATGLRNLTSTLSSGTEAAFGNMIAKDELENLKSKFEIVEFTVSSASCILFTTGFIVIDEFMKIYVSGITDFNYQIPLLGYFMLLAEFLYCIRQPFHSLAMANGDFKKTKKSAWIEATINISLSLIMINIFGVVGVAIATVIAMLYRTIYYVFYIKKNIIFRKCSKFFVNRLLTIFIIFVLSVVLFKYFWIIEVSNYFLWIIKSSIVAVTILIITVLISVIFYREQLKYFKNIFINKFVK